MAKETIDQVNTTTGMGAILISVYKYLKDNKILSGSSKTPLIVQQKARVPDTHFERVVLNANLINKPVLSYQNTSTTKEVRLMTFNAAVESNKPVLVDIYKNPTLTDEVWVDFNSSLTTKKDISATSFTGGTLVGGVPLSKSGSFYENYGNLPVLFTCNPNDIITFVVTTDQTSDIDISIRIEEI